MWRILLSWPRRVPWTPWPYQPIWTDCHESATARSGRYRAPAWRRLSGPLWSDPLGRTASCPARYRRVPDRGPRGTYHAVRPLWARGPGVQLVLASQLPQMSWRGPSHLARGPAGRTPRDALRACHLYPAARPRTPGAAEPAPTLWAPLSHGRPDAPGHCPGPQACGRRDWGLRRAPYLAPAT